MSATLNLSEVACWPGGPFVVMAAQAPHMPSVADMRSPGYLTALLSHDSGLTWPDKPGQQIMKAVIAEHGTIFLLFENRNDAEACRRRLLRGLA